MDILTNMVEKYKLRQRITTTTTLLLGIGAVGGAIYWTHEDAFSLLHQIKSDWDYFSREINLTGEYNQPHMSGKIGTAAVECFFSAGGGGGVTRVYAENRDDEYIVLFREKNGQQIDTFAIETCINEQIDEYTVDLLPESITEISFSNTAQD